MAAEQYTASCLWLALNLKPLIDALTKIYLIALNFKPLIDALTKIYLIVLYSEDILYSRILSVL